MRWYAENSIVIDNNVYMHFVWFYRRCIHESVACNLASSLHNKGSTNSRGLPISYNVLTHILRNPDVYVGRGKLTGDDPGRIL